MVELTIRSRKLKRDLHFVANQAGYVFINPTAASWGRQIFSAAGDAVIAKNEDDLRKIARRYIATHEIV